MSVQPITQETPVVASVEPKAQRFEQLPVNFSKASALYNKAATSENKVVAVAQKTAFVVASFFVAIAEAIQNFVYSVANLGISLANKVHAKFAKEEAPVEAPEVALPEARTRMERAKDFVRNAAASAQEKASTAFQTVRNFPVREFAKANKPVIAATSVNAAAITATYFVAGTTAAVTTAGLGLAAASIGLMLANRQANAPVVDADAQIA